MPEPFISVIVCSRDRAGSLRRMLESACALEVPAGLRWELVVVDNGSTDGTAEAVAAFADRLPIRRVFEAEPGIGHARNRGVEAARGDYLCWTDDDVLVDPFWLAAYRDAFLRHPDAAVFGGRILPRLEAPQADWFAARLAQWPISCVVAHRDFGDQGLLLDHGAGRLPWGANFAIRAREQKSLRYDPGLRRLGEETALIARLLHSGAEGRWVPASVMTHLIPSSRQTLIHVRDYFRDVGRVAAHLRTVHRAPSGGRYGPVAWATRNRIELRLLAALSLFVAASAWTAGLRGPALRFWARHGYLRGLAGA